MRKYECAVKVIDKNDKYGYAIEYFTFECDSKLSNQEPLDIACEKACMKYGSYIDLGLEIIG